MRGSWERSGLLKENISDGVSGQKSRHSAKDLQFCSFDIYFHYANFVLLIYDRVELNHLNRKHFLPVLFCSCTNSRSAFVRGEPVTGKERRLAVMRAEGLLMQVEFCALGIIRPNRNIVSQRCKYLRMRLETQYASL